MSSVSNNLSVGTVSATSAALAPAKQHYDSGRSLYNVSFEESKNHLLLSLYTQLTDLGILPRLTPPEAGPACHDFVDPYLLTTSSQAVNEKTNTPEERLFLAETLRWTGHCYQNIGPYNAAGETNDKRFEFLYGTAELLLQNDDRPEAKLELAELYYNTGSFLHLRKNPGDFTGAAETYGKALALNSSPAMQARVHNMRAKLLGQLTADRYHEKVLNGDVQDRFLIAMYHHNHAKLLLQEKRLEEADAALSKTVDYMETSGELHAYFPQFYTTLALIRTLQGRIKEAASARAKAAEHAARNPV